MTLKQLTDGIQKLIRKHKGGTITLDERLSNEYVKGYNKALLDVVLLINQMKQDGHQRKTQGNREGGEQIAQGKEADISGAGAKASA